MKELFKATNKLVRFKECGSCTNRAINAMYHMCGIVDALTNTSVIEVTNN